MRNNVLAFVLFELDVAQLLVCFALTGYATLVLGKQELFNPRPFFLGDATLWYKWNTKQTVPISYVFIAGYIGLSAIVFFGERHLALSRRKTSRERAIRTAMRFALGVWTGTMMSICLVEFGKTYVGRLRPNFAYRCLGADAVPPKFGEGGMGPGTVIADSNCIDGGVDAWDGRRSFPSGHAALATGLGVYAQLWASRVGEGTEGPFHFLSSLAGLAAMGAALWVGASRVVDNAHHVSDVVCGMFLGAWFAAHHFWMVERETRRAEARETKAAVVDGKLRSE